MSRNQSGSESDRITTRVATVSHSQYFVPPAILSPAEVPLPSGTLESTVKAALIYGTCTGNTEHVATLIIDALKPEIELESVDVFKIKPEQLNEWDFVICGIPTWDVGELEYGWSDIYDQLDDIDLGRVDVLTFELDFAFDAHVRNEIVHAVEGTQNG